MARSGRALSVWAPFAERVEVVVGAHHRIAMARCGERGWWCAEVDLAASADEYRFAVDGGPPRPDPRSAFQPHGVDGPSRVVDHHAFPWADATWRGLHLPGAVLYELHVGTFTPEGTFGAAIERLDHLAALGVTAVELMPVAEFSGDRGWGYDGVALFAPHHAYGGPDGLKALVDACHRRSLGVLLDVVYNHLGPAGNYLPGFGPYFTDRYSTPWGDAVNLDGPHSTEVRRFFIDNALTWLRDYHCDGLRLDAVHALHDDSAVHFLEELAARVTELAAEVARPLCLVVESDLNAPRMVRPPLAGGYGATASWSDEFHHAIHAALTGETAGYYEDFGSLAQVAKAFRQAWVYDGIWSPHRRRVHGRPPVGLTGHAFVVFVQNHDQVGNRAAGDRAATLMSPGRLRLAAALALLSPFVPLLFMGEEWGATTPFQYFTDHRDAELGRAVTEGRRREFGYFGWSPDDVPDPQDPATFARSKLRWSDLEDPGHRALLEWHRALIRLRRATPDLSNGRLDLVRTVTDEAGWLSFERGDVAIVGNLTDADREVPVSRPARRVLLASSEGARLASEAVVVLPPDSVAIVALGPLPPARSASG